MRRRESIFCVSQRRLLLCKRNGALLHSTVTLTRTLQPAAAAPHHSSRKLSIDSLTWMCPKKKETELFVFHFMHLYTCAFPTKKGKAFRALKCSKHLCTAPLTPLQGSACNFSLCGTHEGCRMLQPTWWSIPYSCSEAKAIICVGEAICNSDCDTVFVKVHCLALTF